MTVIYLGTIHLRLWHFLGGGGGENVVKNWPNLPMDSSKKLPTEAMSDLKNPNYFNFSSFFGDFCLKDFGKAK
jgi:hypothetical protein